MNQYLSDKIKILSTVSILLVLFIHVAFYANEVENCTIFPYIQHLMGKVIGSCAVPLFFMISGYLFFLKVPDGLYSIFQKMKKRVRTLLVPYLIAALFFVLFFIAIESIPGADRFMNSSLLSVLSKQNILQILQNVFWSGTVGDSPLAYHLWFLRDLLIIVVFSPVIFYCLKYLKWIWIVILFALIYFKLGLFLNITAFFYFSFGGLLVNYSRLVNLKSGKYVTLALLLLSLIIIAAKTILPDYFLWQIVNIPVTLLLILALWQIYNFVVPSGFVLSKQSLLSKITSYNFFIYLFHIPPMFLFKKAIVFSLGKTELAYFVSYFISPVLIVCMYVCMAQWIRRKFPQFYSVIVGGR
ncbi:MAG: acyltransferase [Prevotellaceae bacterium]|jgi:peptidoglycan/LPS O-acetylase OafA/YrhL|nr:acyltransferase [Prevotellaceae bacterium]